MHAGMYNACEELRKTVGPEGRGEGYLYRVAMEKKGVWGTEAIPIEYARFQTDSPAKEPWNHDWKR
jgi:large subunit ribosomal protein L40